MIVNWDAVRQGIVEQAFEEPSAGVVRSVAESGSVGRNGLLDGG